MFRACMICIWAVVAWVGLNVLVMLASSVWHWMWCRTVSWTAKGILPSAELIEKGEGRTAVLFVHGFNDVPYVWRRFVDELSARGFHCRAMRLPGAGVADCHPTLADLRRAVDKELKDLRMTHERVVLVGHSMGGALATDTVLRASASGDGVLPDKLVLLAPLVEVSRARSPIFSPYVYYRAMRTFLPMLRWVPSVFKEYLHAEDDASFVYRRDHFNEMGWYDSLFALVASMRRAESRTLGVPTVVYVAGDDRVVDSEATRIWFRRRKDARIVECPGSSHVIPLNCHWHEIVSEIAVERHS